MNLKQIILDFPKQFAKGIEIAKNTKIKGKFNRVVICGMGGSALAGDILAKYLEKEIPIIADRTYQLPKTDKKSLIFISSYSGNTEEKIAEYKEAREKKLNMVVFCSGGELEKLCQRDKVPLVKFPKGFPPRYSLGLEFSAMATVLANSGLIKHLNGSYAGLLRRSNADLEKKGKKLAKEIVGKIPLIYASDKYKSLAYNWKIKFNENSKIMAFWNVFPELNHNELVGLIEHRKTQTKAQKNTDLFHAFILKSPDDYSKVKKRMDLTAKMIKEKGGEVSVINLQGKNYLEKTFSGILLGDWASYWLALEYGVDPVEVEVVEEFKRKLTL